MRFTRAFTVVMMSLAVVVLGLAAPSHAQQGENLSITDLPGSWVGTGSGFIGTKAVTNQLWVQITKTNGRVGTGTQRWRSCQGRQQACQERSTRGGGWTKREPVSIALLTNGTIAGADRDGSLSGYVQGDGSIEIVYSEKSRSSAENYTVVTMFRLVRIS